MTAEKTKYEPQDSCDPHNLGLPDPRERILTAAEMNDLPKDVVLKYAFSKQFNDAKLERERLAAMHQPKEKVYTESQLRAMSNSEMWERGFGGGMPGGGQG